MEKNATGTKDKEREVLPDIIKGFTIILVVFAHCIQEGSGAEFRDKAMYFNDKCYQLIYSFHMPLFMLISGYLSRYSFDRVKTAQDRMNLLKKRSVNLLLPVFLWTAIDYGRILLTNYLNGNSQPKAIIFVYFYTAFQNLWFLWAVFWGFLVVYFVHFKVKNPVIIYGILFLLMFITPDGMGLGAYKYMLPYFMAGFYLNTNKIKSINFKSHLYVLMTIILGILFVFLLQFFESDTLIYLSGYKLIGKDISKQILLDGFRMVIGFIGSFMVISIFKILVDTYNEKKCKLFTIVLDMFIYLGKKSMGIYILSGYVLVFVIQKISQINEQNYFLNFVETIFVVTVSAIITTILEKMPFFCKLVGGARKK